MNMHRLRCILRVRLSSKNRHINSLGFGDMHPHNRPHSVDKATGDFLFLLYQLLFEADVSLWTKQRTLETAAESKNSWRVVSISTDAVNHIRTTGSAKGLRRGHALSRNERAKHLFERSDLLDRDELLRYFFEHDTVALITSKENSKDGVTEWSELLPVPEGLFNAGSFSIYARKGKELAWVAQLRSSAKE